MKAWFLGSELCNLVISLGVLVIQELTTELYKTVTLSLLYVICFQRLRFQGDLMMQYTQVYFHPWTKCHSFTGLVHNMYELHNIYELHIINLFTHFISSNSGLAWFLSAKKFIALQTANCNLNISLVSVSFASIYFQISLIWIHLV